MWNPKRRFVLVVAAAVGSENEFGQPNHTEQLALITLVVYSMAGLKIRFNFGVWDNDHCICHSRSHFLTTT